MSASKPEFRFCHRIDTVNGKLQKDSYILTHPEGSIEGWRSGSKETGFYGGIEIHSPKPLFDFAPEPVTERCNWTVDGKCWPSGSSLAYERELQFIFNEPDYVEALLRDWWNSRFTQASGVKA